MIISVANLKGGLRRTTSTVLLAEAYSRMGKKVAIADTSWDGGAAHWLKLARQSSNVSPIVVREFPIDATLQAHEVVELGDNGIVIVDTNSHQEQTLRELDGIVDRVAVPFDGASVSVTQTRRTLLVVNKPTTWA